MADYDLVVIGAGATGLGAARKGRSLGARVALVESERPGGDCTFYGCVPSKALIETAKRVHAARTGASYGFTVSSVDVDFAAVMQRVHDTIEEISEDESPALLASQGIDLIVGHAAFVDPHTLDVDGRAVTGRSFVIASGAGPFVPPIDGLAAVPYLTNRTIFGLTSLPAHLLVLGGGPIGVEQAQVFRRLGARVTVLQQQDRLLVNDDPEASAVIAAVLQAEGVDLRMSSEVVRVSDGPTVHLGDGTTVSGSHLLVAVGRRPNTASLGLDIPGVEVGKVGQVVVDEHLRTTAPHIYAAGDCSSPLQFTHLGDEHGRLAAANAVSRKRRKSSVRVVPWTTFTEPEVAHVGLTEAAAYAKYGARAMVAHQPLSVVDRARCAGQTDGFIKLVVLPRGPGPLANPVLAQVIGGTVVAPGAGDILGEVVLAMQTKAFAGRLAQTIHAYPTWGLGVRQTAALLDAPYLGAELRPARP